MGVDLSSKHMAFYLRLPEGTWDLHALPAAGVYIEEGAMSARWRKEGSQHSWDGSMPEAQLRGPELTETVHGRCSLVEVDWSLPSQQVDLRMEFAIGQEVPLFLLRFRITNHGASPLHLDRIDLLRVGSRPVRRGLRHLMRSKAGAVDRAGAGYLRLDPKPGEQAFFSHGWQSWSYTGTLREGDHFPRTRLGLFTSPLRVNRGTPQPKDKSHFASDMFGVIGDRQGRKGILTGFLSQRQAFGSLEVRLNRFDPGLRVWANADGVWLEPGRSFETDWACVQFVDLDSIDPMAPYIEAAARESGARMRSAVPVGWCSWYQFFDDVTQEDVIANLNWAQANRTHAPLDVIQIDDGFQSEVGDWFHTSDRFSSELPALSRSIRQAGFQPGLWLAPFIVKPDAKLVSEHPEWLLHNAWGRPVNAGFIWNTFTHALDVTHPAVLDRVRKLVSTAVNEWGFDYLKLDFLYAGALSGEAHDSTLTRAQALRRALEAIREAAGEETTLLGCGCPIGSGIGIFDAMRIGADVAPNWRPNFKGVGALFGKEPDLPAARNAIRNTLTRAPMHRRWWVNDPDCVLLRASDTKLTEAEVQTLATVVALSGGSLFVSDHLPDLDEVRLAWLARLIPPLPLAAVAVDWFDAKHPSRLMMPLNGAAGEWHLVALLNWTDRLWETVLDLGDFGIPPAQTFHGLEFWSGAYRMLEGSGPNPIAIRPHGVKLLAIRPAGKAPQWVGDTLHISQGLVLKQWQPRRESLSARIEPSAQVGGNAWVSLPRRPTEMSLDGVPLHWRHEHEGVYGFKLQPLMRGELRIDWR